jgi:hypothetical protein
MNQAVKAAAAAAARMKAGTKCWAVRGLGGCLAEGNPASLSSCFDMLNTRLPGYHWRLVHALTCSDPVHSAACSGIALFSDLVAYFSSYLKG